MFVPDEVNDVHAPDTPGEAAAPIRRGPTAAQRAALVERAKRDAAERRERLRQQHAPDPPSGRRWCANSSNGCRELARLGKTRCGGCASYFTRHGSEAPPERIAGRQGASKK